MKQFVRSLGKNSNCFNYISKSFPVLSKEKLKAGMFDGPQIRKLIKDNNFINSMTAVEALAWQSFVLVVKNFLGNHKSENYRVGTRHAC